MVDSEVKEIQWTLHQTHPERVQEVRARLSEVIDPEIGMTIIQLAAKPSGVATYSRSSSQHAVPTRKPMPKKVIEENARLERRERLDLAPGLPLGLTDDDGRGAAATVALLALLAEGA